MSSCSCNNTPVGSENGDIVLDPQLLSLPGDQTPEEDQLEKEGCFRSLQVYRYNMYQKELNFVNKLEDDPLTELLYGEEELRKNCQQAIALRDASKDKPTTWGLTTSSKFEDEMSELKQLIWYNARAWSYIRGWILGSSGLLQRGFSLWRSEPLWFMHPVLVEDCQARGGCCGRDCGCCLDSERAKTSAGVLGVGHCTVKCGCCLKARGFELDEKTKEYYVEHFSFNNQLKGLEHKDYAYEQRIILASIWGLSVKTHNT